MENSEESVFNEVKYIIDENDIDKNYVGKKIIDSLVDAAKPFIPKFYMIDALFADASLPTHKNHNPNVIEDPNMNEYLKVYGKNIFNTKKNNDLKIFSKGLSTFDKFMKYYKRKANREKLYNERRKLGRKL